jgi:hypothetical protein
MNSILTTKIAPGLASIEKIVGTLSWPNMEDTLQLCCRLGLTMEGFGILSWYHSLARRVRLSRSPSCGRILTFIDLDAGKSTLIKLLLDLKRTSATDTAEEVELAAPVIGRAESDMPTSADVHLYADSQLCTTERPLLYADCEGFEGGERPPIAQVAVDRADRSQQDTMKKASTNKDEHRLRKLKRSVRRKLRWAQEDVSNSDKTSRRGFAVAEMYPKIFYAFSDVIVFVLNNPK